MEHIVKLANHSLRAIVRVANWALIQVKETSIEPNAKSSCVALKIKNLILVLIVLIFLVKF